jgi:uncharacterized protein (TIGR02996 family)
MILMRPLPPTTDEHALLAAIAAAPLDDAPRLVYADWLQERGDETRADYLRMIVTLMHPPEDTAVVERCVALADGLDMSWRQAVGGRFEVVLSGTGGVHLTTFLLRMVVGLFAGELVGPWHKGEPIPLKSGLTREDAAAFLGQFRDPLLRLIRPQDPSADIFARPMAADVRPTLFAPGDPP